MPRLLLINPQTSQDGLGSIRETSWPPLNLPTVAALTPSEYNIEVLDENIERFEYRPADLVGITAFTSSVNRAYEISQIYRKRGIPTVMGGIHVSMLPEEALKYCDAVVVGEAESIWPTVLREFEKGKLKEAYYGTWEDLEKLPIPRRDILNNQFYKWGTLQTSRGCPMDCSFCSVTAFNGRRFRRRSLDAVIEELEQIPQNRVLLVDDNLIGYGREDLEWAYSFFSAILKKGIKKQFFAQASIQFGEEKELIKLAAKAGLKVLFVGMESINPETLMAFNKNLNLEQLQQNKYHESIRRIRNAGIVFLGAFVLGGDEDDIGVFHSTLEFIKSTKIDIIQVTKPTPLPGTKLWHELKEEGRILDLNLPKDWENFRLSRMLYKPAKMDIEDVYKGFTYLRKKYFSSKETIKRTLSTLMATKSITATALGYKYNASFRKVFELSDHFERYGSLNLDKQFKP